MSDPVPFISLLILTVGLPGSGKSFWAYQQSDLYYAGKGPYASMYTAFTVIERDLVRYELTGSQRDHTKEAVVTRITQQRARAALLRGEVVVISDTNIRPKYRTQWMALASECGARAEVKHFTGVPLSLCLERNARRHDPVPEEIILKMYQTLLDNGEVPPVGSYS
jgi:predicted kinase